MYIKTESRVYFVGPLVSGTHLTGVHVNGKVIDVDLQSRQAEFSAAGGHQVVLDAFKCRCARAIADAEPRWPTPAEHSS